MPITKNDKQKFAGIHSVGILLEPKTVTARYNLYVTTIARILQPTSYDITFPCLAPTTADAAAVRK